MGFDNLIDAFASRVAFGALPDAREASYWCQIVGHTCDTYTCQSSHDCITAFECWWEYACSGGFTCPDFGAGNDFTCHEVYNGYCPPSVPCPGT